LLVKLLDVIAEKHDRKIESKLFFNNSPFTKKRAEKELSKAGPFRIEADSKNENSTKRPFKKMVCGFSLFRCRVGYMGLPKECCFHRIDTGQQINTSNMERRISAGRVTI
jgi:hypothetical protein